LLDFSVKHSRTTIFWRSPAGPIFRHVKSTLHSPAKGYVMYMSNRTQEAPVSGELGSHTDQSYTAKPVLERFSTCQTNWRRRSEQRLGGNDSGSLVYR
jgi:hypothetical protein